MLFCRAGVMPHDYRIFSSKMTYPAISELEKALNDARRQKINRQGIASENQIITFASKKSHQTKVELGQKNSKTKPAKAILTMMVAAQAQVQLVNNSQQFFGPTLKNFVWMT